jgi:hypothetical protein
MTPQKTEFGKTQKKVLDAEVLPDQLLSSFSVILSPWKGVCSWGLGIIHKVLEARNQRWVFAY